MRLILALLVLAPLVLVAVFLANFCLAADPPVSTPLRPSDPLNQAAFEHYYNLDHDAAIQDFEKILARHPNDPFAVNHLLSAIQVRELYRMGAMNTGDYSNDNFIGQAHRPADPAQKERIKQLVQQAEKLENAELARDPNNVDMLYARGVTRGQFALYTALIERAWFSALRNAVGARHDHERVLELDPHYTDAKLVVGAHNYVMGNLPLAVKIAVALVGLSGDKEKGLQYLNDAYRGNGETSVDAGIVLMVFLRREHRYAEALQIAGALGSAVPAQLSAAAGRGEPAARVGEERRGRGTVSPRVAERARGKVRQSALRACGRGAGRSAARREEISSRGGCLRTGE